MIPRANINAWRKVAPWPDSGQVEQDLVLSRALVEMYSQPEITGALSAEKGPGPLRPVARTEARGHRGR